ncbi:MAG TPA: putative toxin-antitoxin system toxin component, PIN family [Pinirhizobacter sp.]
MTYSRDRLIGKAIAQRRAFVQPDAMSAQISPSRVVLDTNVCLDLFFFRDPRCQVLAQALAEGRVQAVSRADCHAEWLRVLTYPDLPITDAGRQQAMAAYDGRLSFPALEDKAGTALPRCRDPDDQMFLEVALAAGASALVTKDNELLRLASRCPWFAIVLPEAWQP